jgi:hypothetical protein
MEASEQWIGDLVDGVGFLMKEGEDGKRGETELEVKG